MKIDDMERIRLFFDEDQLMKAWRCAFFVLTFHEENQLITVVCFFVGRKDDEQMEML